MCNYSINTKDIESYLLNNINYLTHSKIEINLINTKNSILKERPELFCFWDFNKNSSDIYEITSGSQKKFWWYCPFCRESYLSSPQIKCKTKAYLYCSIVNVNHFNSFYFLYANNEIFEEWDYDKNKIVPINVTPSSNEKVWWLGKCGHEWEATISSRFGNSTNCPYCSNQQVLIGFNDMWTTNPELASLLANPEDGYKYTQSSGMKVDWKCKNCGTIVENKVISNVKIRGLKCELCSDKISFGEKIIYTILKNKKIEFYYDFKLLKELNKRYDFYLPEYNTIIEVYGIQHYEKGHYNARNLEQEQENDRYKELLAKENGIEHYIVIDARKSELEWIKDSINNSVLPKIINLSDEDYDDLELNFNNSIIHKSWQMRNSNMSIKDIAKELSIGVETIRSYLKIGASLNKCDYNPNIREKKVYRKIAQLNLDGSLIRCYDTIKEACLLNNFKTPNKISQVCKGKRKNYKGFLWMYKDEYDNK